MNREDIIRMAREAGLNNPLWIEGDYEIIERFAKLISAAERDACAKVCDEQQLRSAEASDKAKRQTDAKLYHHCSVTAGWNAAAIRARGQQ